ncbi:stage III sporulation protein AA [Acetivibrio ethanolgignens]|uniref:Stage III sporulation protein AA n=1 Tax=Acetivibrio ethanolgignens TaxID=290052 RepID=A0A0V8QFH1_9FIRM|nr:stage III sporulation protein AA [Acetivibrio ethanolgignens]KSV59327.1 stage III sporulation protein AA [Acetivibrio ethanolgignens]
MDKKEEINRLLSLRLRRLLGETKIDYEKLQEIRLRIGWPVMLIYNNREQSLGQEGGFVTKNELRETMEYICNYSMYAFEEELKQGFLTIQGGHRVGVGGKVIVEKEKVKNIKYISCLNIRLAHEVRDCARGVMPELWCNEEKRWYSTLVVSPPRCGKTTLLRDMIRAASEGNIIKAGGQNIPGVNVGVVDERSELGACYLGVPQNNLGRRTDILDCCPKAEGIMMLIRSMSPTIVAVDEIGGQRDKEALEQAVNCGCTIFATAHGACMEDIKRRGLECFFERILILEVAGEPGRVQGIYNRKGERVC